MRASWEFRSRVEGIAYRGDRVSRVRGRSVGSLVRPRYLRLALPANDRGGVRMERVTGRQVLRQAVTAQSGRVTASAVLSAMHQAGEALVPVVIGVVIDRAVARGS